MDHHSAPVEMRGNTTDVTQCSKPLRYKDAFQNLAMAFGDIQVPAPAPPAFVCPSVGLSCFQSIKIWAPAAFGLMAFFSWCPGCQQ